ncbi:MAG: protein kinase, partial [Gemmataceae bacterium]
PNIVQGLEVNASENRFYYIMEYVHPAKDLHAWQNNKPLYADHPHRYREITGLLISLVQGLVAAHRVSLVHRDLHYGNILVQAKDGSSAIEQLKICDFGLARPLGSTEPTHLSQDKPGILPFLAPELFAPDPAITPALDLYSVGVIGYYMVTGQTPYPKSGPEVPEKICRGQWTPLRQLCPKVPTDLETILSKCLRVDPLDRYLSAEELADDLERHRQGQRIRSWRTLRLDRVATFTRTKPLLSAVFSSVSLLLVLAAALGAFAGFQWVQAERNGQQAQHNEQLAREETRERLTVSARASLKRGDLANAESFFDRAIEISPPEVQRELAFERLATLTPNGRWDRLQSELDRLAGEEGLTESQRAQLLLYQGDLDLMDSIISNQTRGKKRLREALALGLNPVDAAYARGLLATGFNSAIAEFEKLTAANADPFHYRGNCCLLACYVLSGQLGAARRRAELLERVFPQEPIVPLMRGILASLEGDVASRAYYHEQIRRQVPPPQNKQMLAILDWLDQVIRQAPKGGGLMVFAQPLNFVGIRLGDLPRHIGVGLPVWHYCFDQFNAMANGYSWTILGWSDAADQELHKAAEMSPEGFIRFQQGVVSYIRLSKLMKSKRSDPREQSRLYQLAARQFREASEAPTLFPFLPFRRQAVWMRFIAEASLRTHLNRQQEPAAAVGWVGLSPIETLGPLAWSRQPLSSGLAVEPFAQLLKADPEGDREIRAVMLPGLLTTICTADEARLLLQRWILDEPTNPKPRELLRELRP